MAVGYTRQSSGLIISGATILASHFNNEYNAIESAFHATTGHNHDGTGGGGAKILLTTGVTGTLPVANGGTGATTTAGANTALKIPFRGATNIVSGSTAVATTDKGICYIANTTSGNVTLTLPAAATAGAGFMFSVVKTAAANQVIVDPNGAEVIQSDTTYTLDGDDEAAVIFCDGSVWHVLSAEYPASLLSKSLLVQSSVSGWQTALSLLPGTDIVAFDAGLNSIAGLTTSANQMIYTTNTDVYATATLTPFARTILDDATQGAVQTTLGVVPGTNVQVYDASLTSLAALATAADKLPYATGVDTYAETGLTAFGRSLIDDATAGDAQTTLGVPPNSRDIIAGVGLSGGGDLSADRTLTLDLQELSVATAAPTDYAAIEDVTDNSTKKVTLQSIADMAPAGVGDIKITTFTANGTWTRDANCLAVEVIVVGGGGGGGGANATNNDSAGGGGGGGTAIKGLTPAAAGASQSITIGSGGAGDTGDSSPGGAGGTSSFGAICSATGGAGGKGSTNADGTGAVGGVGSGGDVNLTGGSGGGPTDTFADERGGMGGGTFVCPGNGGVGAGTDGDNAVANTGCGGGGGCAVSSGNNGGAGAAGIVIVKEWLGV